MTALAGFWDLTIARYHNLFLQTLAGAFLPFAQQPPPPRRRRRRRRG